MWYPVDSISAFTNKDSGYQGKTPLYYCSQADGNFTLAEKRKPFYLEDGHLGCTGAIDDINDCHIVIEKVTDDRLLDDPSFDDKFGELRDDYDEYMVYFREDFQKKCTFERDARIYRVAIPKGVGKVQVKAKGDYLSYNIDDGTDFYNKPVYQGDTITYVFKPTTGGNGCAKDYDQLIKFVDGEAWYPYNGLQGGGESDLPRAREDERADESIPYGGGAVSGDNDPLLKVYDYETNAIVSYKEYDVRCKTLEKVVSDNGSNKAWAVRSSTDTEEESTPDFLNNYYTFSEGLNQYNYSRDDQPFGSAVLSTEAFDDEIVFKNKNNENDLDSYAGLPYGCEADTPPGNIGCKSLGFCSNQPNLTCLLLTEDEINESEINKGQCGENDECVPYAKSVGGWYPVPLPDDGKTILKNIFLKSYSTHEYGYNNGNGSWNIGSDPYDYSPAGENPIPFCGEERPEAGFCYIHPRIENIELYKAGQKMDFNDNTNSFVIYESGNYDLKFNSIIDKEQLPLYEIVIAWGDGSIQTITDQDYRPNEEQPHIISHNYIGIVSETEIEIKILIRDNWGFTRCCRSDNDCSYMQNPPPSQCPVKD
jgi:hypothetical protein